MTSSNGNIFRVTGPLCGEFTSHRWIPLIKGQWRRVLIFSLIYAWIIGWVNNRETGDFDTQLRSLWRDCNALLFCLETQMYTHNQISWICPDQMTSSNGNFFRVAGLLCGEFTGHRWISLTKSSDAALWWTNDSVNNCEAGDLRRHCAHYDAIVMYPKK